MDRQRIIEASDLRQVRMDSLEKPKESISDQQEASQNFDRTEKSYQEMRDCLNRIIDALPDTDENVKLIQDMTSAMIEFRVAFDIKIDSDRTIGNNWKHSRMMKN